MYKKWIWPMLVVMPLVVGGLVYGSSLIQTNEQTLQDATSYVCPVTGEEFPCPECCPFNESR